MLAEKESTIVADETTDSCQRNVLVTLAIPKNRANLMLLVWIFSLVSTIEVCDMAFECYEYQPGRSQIKRKETAPQESNSEAGPSRHPTTLEPPKKRIRRKDKELGKIKMNTNNIRVKILARKVLNQETVKTTLFKNFKHGLYLFLPGDLDCACFCI